MKILVVSQYFPPENTPIPASVSDGLNAAGHQVRVLTGFPNYPTGRLVSGYRQAWRTHEQVHGIDVLRVPLWVDHSQSVIRRTLNYGSFALSAATASGFARGADVIYVYATQMTPALGPWLWRIAGGAPYVLHVQDLWPDSIMGSSLVGSGRATKLVDTLLTPWLTSVYRRSAAVVGIAPSMVEMLAERGVARSKLHLVYNWADERQAVRTADRDARPSSDGGATILYAGNVGDMQALEVAVQAARNARDARVRLQIVGDGMALSRVKALAHALQAENVEFHERVPQAEMTRYYSGADYALVSLKDLPAFRGTIPSKVQNSLAHGLPLITTVQGDVRKIVEDAGVGHTADSESVVSLENAFRQAASDSAQTRRLMTQKALIMHTERFSRSAAITAIEGILTQAAQG